jgi:hypothetical protein
MTTKIAAFYVNGASIDGGPAAVTPWNTPAAARLAAQAYVLEVNLWYETKVPGDGPYTTDDDIVADTLHEDGNGDPLRYGVGPFSEVVPHPTATAAYVEEWLDGSNWMPV